jgi:DNA-binding transcriptional MerR regulator
MYYKIKEIARIAGVSTRTIRYYDTIGLLVPVEITDSLYRLYDESSINRLQLILLYKEIGFELQQIKTILDQPNLDYVQLLLEQRDTIKKRIETLHTIVNTINQTINHYKGGIQMKHDEQFKGLKEETIAKNEQQYGEEVREKYGEEVVEASYDKVRKMSKWEWQEADKISKEILEKLALAMNGTPEDDLAQEVCQLHQRWIQFYWPTYSKEAHLSLVEMYTQDERFTAYYDAVKPGASAFLFAAMQIYLNSSK